MDEQEMQQLIKLVYQNLSDVLLEGIKAFTMSRRQFIKRHKVIIPDFLKAYYESGISIIGVTGHINNWEWGSISASYQVSHKILAFYKPLSNKWIDKLVLWSRIKSGTTLASITETSLTFERWKGTPTIFLMVADQSPASKDKAYWVDFLGRETAFLHGPEKHARNNDYPVMFTEIRRVKRGYYEVHLSLLAEKPSALPDGEITRRYVAKLNSLIRSEPQNWLWSHRRWKLSR